jgi:hypothetical protein
MPDYPSRRFCDKHKLGSCAILHNFGVLDLRYSIGFSELHCGARRDTHFRGKNKLVFSRTGILRWDNIPDFRFAFAERRS